MYIFCIIYWYATIVQGFQTFLELGPYNFDQLFSVPGKGITDRQCKIISSTQKHVNLLSAIFRNSSAEWSEYSSISKYWLILHILLRIWHILRTFFVSLKPGSHAPQTYLGHGHWHSLGQRCGICEHLSPTHNLSQALIACEELNSAQLHRQAGGQCLGHYVSAINVHICCSCPRPYRQLCPR